MRALLVALNDTQRTIAVIQPTAPGDITTMIQVKPDPKQLAGNAPGRGGRAAEPPRDVPVGISYKDLTAAQRDMLMKVIDSYTSAMLPEAQEPMYACWMATSASSLTLRTFVGDG